MAAGQIGLCIALSLVHACQTRLLAWRGAREGLRSIPAPTVKSFRQKVDHFNFGDDRSFVQRYFVHDRYFRSGGPMFFYTGNEGPLDEFYNNTGLPFDWAEEFGALVVFAEHRYYGETLPFGEDSFTNDNLGYLSISQVLADFAALASSIKEEVGISRVVAFGGSYGGMLSAWARIKYPNVFSMALAASAPIPQAVNLIDPQSFYKAVTDDARKANDQCPDAVRAGFAAVIELARSQEGRVKIKDTFELCEVFGPSAANLSHFIQYARNAWTEMAMCNYPYPSSFLAPLPAWPIKAACEKVLAESDPLIGLAAAVAMPYRIPGASCFDTKTLFVECADQTGCGTGNAARAWDYQMCTEISYDQATTNVSDMFPPRNWTLANASLYCKAHYNVEPNPSFSRVHLGGVDMVRTASKIIFSNGLLDPWHGGGYLKDQGPSLPAVVIDLGAHHLDLRIATADDPPDVIAARAQEKAYIKQWLEEDGLLCSAQAPTPPGTSTSTGVPAGGVVAIALASAAVAAAAAGFLAWRRTRARTPQPLQVDYPTAQVSLTSA